MDLKTIVIKQIRSAVGKNNKQRVILKALGLNKMNRIKELEDTESVRGNITKVSHLVEIIE